MKSAIFKQNKHIIRSFSRRYFFCYRQCKIIRMERKFPISDNELNALFMGLVRIIKQKVEHDMTFNPHTPTQYERLLALYKQKVKECNALKNQLIQKNKGT